MMVVLMVSMMVETMAELMVVTLVDSLVDSLAAKTVAWVRASAPVSVPRWNWQSDLHWARRWDSVTDRLMDLHWE